MSKPKHPLAAFKGVSFELTIADYQTDDVTIHIRQKPFFWQFWRNRRHIWWLRVQLLHLIPKRRYNPY